MYFTTVSRVFPRRLASLYAGMTIERNWDIRVSNRNISYRWASPIRTSEVRLWLCYILAMEVARQLEPSASRYKGGWVTKKFTVTALAVVLVAAIFGGTIGSGRKLSSLTSSSAGNSYRVIDDIEKDY